MYTGKQGKSFGALIRPVDARRKSSLGGEDDGGVSLCRDLKPKARRMQEKQVAVTLSLREQPLRVACTQIVSLFNSTTAIVRHCNSVAFLAIEFHERRKLTNSRTIS